MKLAEQVLKKSVNEVGMQDALKHKKLAQKEVEKRLKKQFEKLDLWGIHNQIVDELAKKDGLDVAELSEFEVEPYDIIINSAMRSYFQEFLDKESKR